MNKYIVILALGMSLAPLVFIASNQAKIEKRINVVVIDDVSLVPVNPMVLTYQDFSIKLDFITPEAIVIQPLESQYQDWKPFGKVRTKYHSEWLFNPVKLC